MFSSSIPTLKKMRKKGQHSRVDINFVLLIRQKTVQCRVD